MQRVLSAHDRECIKKLIELNLFTKVMPEKLATEQGVIAAFCGDGDQLYDLYTHAVRVSGTNRIHALASNGGGLLMSEQLREKQCRHGNDMVEGIQDAVELKGIKEVFIYTHFPCGIAGMHGLGVIDQGRYLMMAKQRLKNLDNSLRIKCFFHVDMFDEVEGDSHKKRTYFLPKELWNNPDFFQPVLHDFKGMVERSRQ